jgi:hypothetical protein
VLQETVAPWLLGRDSRRIEAVSRHLMTPYLGFASASAEVRAASAVDLALWDLMGKRHGIPVHEALGGASRSEIRTYNTCAGYAYNSGTAKGVAAGRRDIGAGDVAAGPYDDQVAFMRDAGALAESLLAEGYTAMKIWPLDVQAAASGGQMITLPELKAGLEPFRKIRTAVGDRIEVMAELHSLWSAPAAIRICHALEDLGIFWAEDPIAKMDDFKALADLRRRGDAWLLGEAGPRARANLSWVVDLRYLGQNSELSLDLPGGRLGASALARLVAQYHLRHLESYGYEMRGQPVEIVNLRLMVAVKRRAPPPETRAFASGSVRSAIVEKRDVWFPETGFVSTPVYDRDRLPRDCRLTGPAIVEQMDTTTVVTPRAKLHNDRLGYLHIAVEPLRIKAGG